ncbi:hypothetical protein [Pseudomonas sp.]|uniref:hypothetical protein n=1 Tax=Pseudomonas sp. TaxID=306 RepID=UPI002BD2B586|nr:hypothetical protein [Pseudomonas sp.]
MKQTIAISLLLGLFTTSAFALPSQGPMPILGEVQDSQPDVLPQDRHVAEGGAERTLEQRLRTAENDAQIDRRIRVSEGGSERTPGQQRIRVAEGGSERTPGQQRIRVAEGGSERTPGQQRIRVAEGGSERTPGQQRIRVAEGGAERTLAQRIG